MHRTHHPTSPAADLDNPGVVTPANILRGAASYLETHGWHQGTYFASDDLGEGLGAFQERRTPRFKGR